MAEEQTSQVSQYLVWGGTLLTLIGLIALIWGIVQVMRARRHNLSEEETRALLGRVLPTNFGALAVSVLGLMLVILGISFS